jgi:hypothetical protein
MARLLFWQRRRDACPLDEPRSPSYKPVFLRLPFLLFFAVYLCFLFAVLEWGCRVLPAADGFQNVPEDVPVGGRIVVFSAPLVGRHARQTPAPAAGPLQPRVTAAPKIARRSAKSHMALFQKRSGTSGASESDDTVDTSAPSETMASKSSVAVLGTDSVSESETRGTSELTTPDETSTIPPPDISTTDMTFTTLAPTPTVVSGVTVMLRPPVTVGSHKVHPPEYVEVLNLQLGNSTQRFNNSSSSNYTSPLMRRNPDRSKYAYLSGPTVGVSYRFDFDFPHIFDKLLGGEWEVSAGQPTRFKGARLYYEMPSITTEMDCAMEDEAYADMRWGLITCNGPAFVFHDSACFDRWVKAAQIDESYRRARESLGLAWTVLESLDEQGEPMWEGDLVQPCPGSVIAPGNGRQQVDDLLHFITSLILRGPDGEPTGTVDVDVAFMVDPANGKVTSTAMTIRPPGGQATAGVTSIILFDRHRVPTATVPGHVGVITDSRGMPVATTTRVLERSSTVIILRNEKGQPTATGTFALPLPRPTYGTNDLTITLTNSLGVPTATVTGRPVAPKSDNNFFYAPDSDKLYIVSNSVYWLVLYMPVVLALFCAIFSEMISNNLRELLPFNAMTRPDGATAEESLLMPKGVISGAVNSFQLLFRFKQPVSLLSDLLVVCSAIVTTLSTEAIGLRLGGNCLPDNANGCYVGLAVFLPPTRAVQALLIASLLCLLVTAFILWRWDSGVAAPPGSLMATGSLMQNSRVLELFRGIRPEGGVSKNISDRSVVGSLQGQRFKLQHYHTPSQRILLYGMVAKGPRATSTEGLLTDEKTKTWVHKTLTKASTFTKMTKRPSWATTPGILDWSTYRRRTTDKVLDVCGLVYLAGLIILIIYYNVTVNPDTSFERFINDQDSGVRVLFTAFGILLSFFWDYYYARKLFHLSTVGSNAHPILGVALMEPYRQLWRRPQTTVKSIAVAPPTTVFVGIWQALARREVFTSCVALANIISKLTPPLLSNVPFSPVQTWLFHQVATWTATGCLGFLILVLGYGALFVKYPHMPIDPGTVAGKMYYLCDSDILYDFQGFSGLEVKECLTRLDPDWKYTFGKMTGVSGEQRIGVQAHVVAPAKEAPGWEGRESSDREAGEDRPSDEGLRERQVGKQAFGEKGGNGKRDIGDLGNRDKQ